MEKEIYENYLLMRFLFLTMEQINSLEFYEKDYYIKEINEYLESKN